MEISELLRDTIEWEWLPLVQRRVTLAIAGLVSALLLPPAHPAISENQGQMYCTALRCPQNDLDRGKAKCAKVTNAIPRLKFPPTAMRANVIYGKGKV